MTARESANICGFREVDFGELHALWELRVNNHPEIQSLTNGPYLGERDSALDFEWGPHCGNSTHELHRTKLTKEELRDFIHAEAAKLK